MLKFPNISEVCITKYQSVNAKLSLEARTPKTLIKHLSTQVNLIQYFHSFFTFI